MSWLLVPWLQGHLIMHEPALILFQTGFHISTQTSILQPMSKSKVRGSYMKTKIRKDQLTKEEMEVFREVKSDIFGYEVFRGNTFLSFQSNLNIPTPLDYVIGPGDKLFIDIYGESENYYQSEVSPDGDVILENIGQIGRAHV